MKTNNKGGRPPANVPRVAMVSLMVRLDAATVEALDAAAAARDCNRQDVIRLAVRELLARKPRKTAGK